MERSEETMSPDVFYETEKTNKANTGQILKSQFQSERLTKRSDDEDDDENQNNPVQEVLLPSKVYQDLFSQFPPNPLLPKYLYAKDDSPRSGGLYKFMKIAKFRGIDHGRSKFRDEAMKIEKISFPEGITMKKIFKVINQKFEQNEGDQQPIQVTMNTGTDDNVKIKQDPLMTQYGELVYMRNSTKDFLVKQKNFVGEQKDEVLEENLLDVKNLLKFSASSQAANGKQAASKSLVNLQGVEPFYTKKSITDKTLIFESRFESGNLAAALKVADNDYYLALQNDVNTTGNTQWFLFRVSNTRAYNLIRFSMLNLCKPDSLYNEGMKVLIYSEKFAAAKDIGWHRGGQKIAYYPNGIRKEGSKGFKTMYTMTFSYEFEYDDDIVYFAYCYPYTYTELMDELNAIMADPIKQQYVQKKTLADTLAGNKCEVLTITSKQNIENMAKRKGVILTARVHPGESVGSWMMKGALDFLVDPNSVEAEYLRQNFVFKVVPMLNPDGVINGNYRCSLAGCDLNRRWKRPSKVLHPTIFATKQLCAQFAKERELQIFCDFHGHSRRKNIFMYGCNVPDKPEETRLFPFIMSQICPFFIYNHSRFGNQKSKESTARMALFNELKCPAIYTIESSFCGNDTGPYKNYHFSTNNLMQTGRDFCRTLMIYLPIQIPKTIVSQFMQNINDLFHHYKIISDSKLKQDPEVEAMKYYFDRLEKVKQSNKEIQSKHLRKGLETVLRQTADVFNDANSFSSAGSDHAPSEDNLDLDEIEKILPVSEDPDLANKLKTKKTFTKDQDVKKDGAQSIQNDQTLSVQSSQAPYKKKNTIQEGKRKSVKLGINSQGQAQAVNLKLTNKEKKKLTDNDDKIDEEDEFEADDEICNEKVSQGSEKKEEEQKQTLQEENNQDNVVNIVQKKRRRKNVESKDACTQTERSDYMLIKQRQIEKQKQLQQVLLNKKNQNENILKEQSPVKQMLDHQFINVSPERKNEQIIQGQQSNSKQHRQNISGLKKEFKINQLVDENQIDEIKKMLGDNIQNKGIIIQQININSSQNSQQLTQKLVDEYLNKQKQGLVENIINQYNRQTINTTPIQKNQQYDLVDFSNFIIKQQTKDNQVVFSQLQAKNSENSPTNIQSSLSPSKKHRHLVQTRQGAQQIINHIIQPSNAVGGKSKIESKFVHSQNQSSGAIVGEINIVNEYLKNENDIRFLNQQKEIPLGSGKYQNKKNQNTNQYQIVSQKNKSNSKHGFQQAENYENHINNLNRQNENSNNYTNWEKMSQNNQELTRLFYQLPGGTKSLLQNAINSQKSNGNQKQKNQHNTPIQNKTNLQVQQNHKYPMTAQKQNRIVSNLGKKVSGSTDITANGIIVQSNQNIGLAHVSSQKSKHEFPDIQILNNNSSDIKNGNMSPVMQQQYFKNQHLGVQSSVQGLNHKPQAQNSNTLESFHKDTFQDLSAKKSASDLLKDEKNDLNIKKLSYQNVYKTPESSIQNRQNSKITTGQQNFDENIGNITTPQFSNQKPPLKNRVLVNSNIPIQNKDLKNNILQEQHIFSNKNQDFQSTKYNLASTLSGQNLNRDIQQFVNSEKMVNAKSALNNQQYDKMNRYPQKQPNQYQENPQLEMNRTFVQDNYQFQLQLNQMKNTSYKIQNQGQNVYQIGLKGFNDNNQVIQRPGISIASSSRSLHNQQNQQNNFSSLVQNQQHNQQQYYNKGDKQKNDNLYDKNNKNQDIYRQTQQNFGVKIQKHFELQESPIIVQSNGQRALMINGKDIQYNHNSQTLQEDQRKQNQKIGVLENVFIQQRLRNMSSEDKSQFQIQQIGDENARKNQLMKSVKDNNQKSKSIYSIKDTAHNSNLNRL